MSTFEQTQHNWNFFRIGGFDQVDLKNGIDVVSLDQLDQKLWTALSCPVGGLEIDSRTLELLDTDNDGRIRAPEVIAAVKWAGRVLDDPNRLISPAAELPLAAFNSADPEAQQLLASAKQILINLNKPDAEAISVDDVSDTVKIFAETLFNGDGTVPAEAAADTSTQNVIQDIIDCLGATTDRSGKPGISAEIAEQFFKEANAYSEWRKTAESNSDTILPLGEQTASAATLFHKVKSKVDDYFTRCRLAAYDSRAAGHLSPAEKDYDLLATKTLTSSADEIADFPLAKIEAGRNLPLDEQVNPAWASAISSMKKEIITPLFGDKNSLSSEEWSQITSKFTAFDAWSAEKAGETVEKLGIERIREILSSDAQQAINALIEKDKALEEEAANIAAVEKLVRYHRDLFQLLNNFVSFRDFYSPGSKAIFQAGTLYLDGRSCDLCIKVADPAQHSVLGSLSQMYLAYCNCTRKGSDEKMTIAAAFTDGDSEQLMVGRNGVFYDRQGRDWDATIVKVIENPISIRQAFWAPYRRIVKMISEQIEKFAASKDKAMQDKAATGIAEAGKKAENATSPTPSAFDIGKFAGIFAAIGLAIGAIGTALAATISGFLQLQWWQMPLAIVGVMLLISGPSMLIAYMKLRQRNLGPVLDANGWAVNSRAKINIPFGATLTRIAELPEGASRSLADPFEEKQRPWKFYLFLLVLLAVFGALWQQGYIDQWLGKQQPPASTEATVGPTGAEAADGSTQTNNP